MNDEIEKYLDIVSGYYYIEEPSWRFLHGTCREVQHLIESGKTLIYVTTPYTFVSNLFVNYIMQNSSIRYENIDSTTIVFDLRDISSTKCKDDIVKKLVDISCLVENRKP